MSDAPSPWPERRRTQHLLFGAGALLLAPVVLALAGLVEVGDAVLVGLAAVASPILIYGLLGWGGDWATAGDGGADGDGDLGGGPGTDDAVVDAGADDASGDTTRS